MSDTPDVSVALKIDSGPFVQACRVIAKHLTALADDLERLNGPAADPLAERVRAMATADRPGGRRG